MVKDDVRDLEVEVRGPNFHSKEIRKVMLRVYKPVTFVQTDKPIYLPGQTGNAGLITINNRHANDLARNTGLLSNKVNG